MHKPKQYELAELLAEANRLREADPDLAKTAVFNTRTVHYYVQEGLLPGRSGRRGPGTRYSEEFLYRLLVIRRLQKESALALADIREVMTGIKPSSLQAVALGHEPVTVRPVASEAEATQYESLDEEVMLLRAEVPAARRSASVKMRRAPNESPTALNDMFADTPAGYSEKLDEQSVPSSIVQESRLSFSSAPETEGKIKHTFPLGANAELVLRKSLSAKQMRQLSNIVPLLEDVLADDE